jgi:CRISPR/Cas system CMR-associated protein Cmr5 small subunit
MELLGNFVFYSDCKEAIIESYGDVDIAKAKLKKSKYSDIEDHVLEENLSFIKESLGDKILNFFSKKLGGDVRKLDKILAAMKEEETRFVKDEHESESKFYKLSSGLAQLKRDKASQNEQNIIILKLTNLQKFIKDLVKSHNSIMDDLEKQVDIITKKNNRKADYYNLKRAHDSVETKKMRAEFKKRLIEDVEDNEYLASIQKILGTPKQAEADLSKANDQLAKEKENLGAGEEISKNSEEKVANVLKTYHDEILACLQDVKDYSETSFDQIKDLEKEQKMNQKGYQRFKSIFDKKVEKTESLIQKAVTLVSDVKAEDPNKVEKKNGALEILVDVKAEVENLNYYIWPSEDLKDQKEKIENIINKAIESTRKAA